MGERQSIISGSSDYEKKIIAARSNTEDEDEAREKAVSLRFKRDEIIARIEKAARTLAAGYIKKIKKNDTLSLYKKLITNPSISCRKVIEPLKDEAHSISSLCFWDSFWASSREINFSSCLVNLLFMLSKIESGKQCRSVKK